MLRPFCRLALSLAATALTLDLSATGAGGAPLGRSGTGDASSAPATDAARGSDAPRLALRRTRLDNGLRVVLSRDLALPLKTLLVDRLNSRASELRVALLVPERRTAT